MILGSNLLCLSNSIGQIWRDAVILTCVLSNGKFVILECTWIFEMEFDVEFVSLALIRNGRP